MNNSRLPFESEHEAVESRIDARDRAARERAVDPRFNVALEASAGTGKTRVLVDRYINLLRAGVDPSNILAITFTRKAASEMRDRITATLRAAAGRGDITPGRWRELRDRTADIAISTIDAFCLSLLREFPLEADLDPGFSMADETEAPRLVDESLDRALRICRVAAREDEDVALVFAQLGERRARAGLAALLNRRIVAPAVLSRYSSTAPRELNVADASRRAATALIGTLEAMRGGLDRFIESGPPEPSFLLLTRDLFKLRDAGHGAVPLDPAAVQAVLTRIREHFLTQEGQPRLRSPYPRTTFASDADWEAHRGLVTGHAEAVSRVCAGHRRDVNVLVTRGIWRMFRVAEAEYRRTLDAHAVLDFSDLLLRALGLLRQMEEFSQSRYRLESRYHHVLVDEFQDTSRAQWELVSLLIQSWGEGVGLAHSGPLQPSIFIVGDRKQSIYGFRDADVSVLREAARHLEALRPGDPVRRSMSRSFRSAPALLSFVNDICHDMDKVPERDDAFQYDEEDRFPLAGALDAASARDPDAGLGLVVADTPEACAEITAAEIARVLAAGTTVRDRDTGLPRGARAGDIAILFRTRDSHREFEAALERRGIPAYVYKGLGFFDADEIKDVLALLSYLADPLSDLRAAALMRSRFVRLSDEALRLLAPRLSNALHATEPPDAIAFLDRADAHALGDARTATTRWRGLVDRIPPAELLDLIVSESAYTIELRGPRFHQARENLKKIRTLVRRIQNRGYATLGRVAAHLDRLAVGDEANAVIDALDAVNLMTVHASKGLEFPVVFLVNLARGTGNRRAPIRIATSGGVSVAVGDFQSEADEDETAKEKEETKRLLYVALTRARDRLYLGSVLKDGCMEPGRGSLAEVLPHSLLDRFAAARGGAESVDWRASSGAEHRLRVAAKDTGCHVPSVDRSGHDTRCLDGDFAALTDAARPRRTIAAVVAAVGRGFTPRQAGHGHPAAQPGPPPRLRGGVEVCAAGTPPEGPPYEPDRLVGTLVHRLLQRFGFQAPGDPAPGPPPRLRGGVAVTRQAVLGALRIEDLGHDHTARLDEAVAAYRALCERPDLRALYTGGERLHEVPFTMDADGTFLRGTIDCLVRTAPERLTIVEFKTGQPREEHRLQLDRYRQAAERLFPGFTIEARLVYSGETIVT